MTTPQSSSSNHSSNGSNGYGYGRIRRTLSSTGSLELNMLQTEEERWMRPNNNNNDIHSNRQGHDGNGGGFVGGSAAAGAQEPSFSQHKHPRPQQQQQQQQPQRDHIHYLSTLFAGVGSGALSSFICAPLDLIRTRMQVWGDIQQQQQHKQPPSPSEPSKTKGILAGHRRRRNLPSIGGPAQAFRAILQKEGPRGMFRGLGATLVTVPLFWGVYFPLYDETKDFLTHRQEVWDLRGYHPGVIHCLSAIATGAVADVICNPFFVVRTRLQTQALHELTSGGGASTAAAAANHPRISMLRMALRLKEQHGIPVFWRGMTANLMGLSHCAVQFPAYEFLKGYLRDQRLRKEGVLGSSGSHNNSHHNTVAELLIASGLSKMTASLLTYPHEVLRSRMVDSRASQSPTLSGVARQILRQEGVLGFYNGLGVTLVRVIPNCCVTFLSYELILKHSKEYFGGSHNNA